MSRLRSIVRGFVLRQIYRLQVWLTGISNKPRCPWCGEPCSTETDEVAYDGDCDEMECDACGREFERHVSFECEFWTEKIEP